MGWLYVLREYIVWLGSGLKGSLRNRLRRHWISLSLSGALDDSYQSKSACWRAESLTVFELLIGLHRMKAVVARLSIRFSVNVCVFLLSFGVVD